MAIKLSPEFMNACDTLVKRNWNALFTEVKIDPEPHNVFGKDVYSFSAIDNKVPKQPYLASGHLTFNKKHLLSTQSILDGRAISVDFDKYEPLPDSVKQNPILEEARRKLKDADKAVLDTMTAIRKFRDDKIGPSPCSDLQSDPIGVGDLDASLLQFNPHEPLDNLDSQLKSALENVQYATWGTADPQPMFESPEEVEFALHIVVPDEATKTRIEDRIRTELIHNDRSKWELPNKVASWSDSEWPAVDSKIDNIRLSASRGIGDNLFGHVNFAVDAHRPGETASETKTFLGIIDPSVISKSEHSISNMRKAETQWEIDYHLRSPNR